MFPIESHLTGDSGTMASPIGACCKYAEHRREGKRMKKFGYLAIQMQSLNSAIPISTPVWIQNGLSSERFQCSFRSIWLITEWSKALSSHSGIPGLISRWLSPPSLHKEYFLLIMVRVERIQVFSGYS